MGKSQDGEERWEIVEWSDHQLAKWLRDQDPDWACQRQGEWNWHYCNYVLMCKIFFYGKTDRNIYIRIM